MITERNSGQARPVQFGYEFSLFPTRSRDAEPDCHEQLMRTQPLVGIAEFTAMSPQYFPAKPRSPREDLRAQALGSHKVVDRQNGFLHVSNYMT